MLALRRLLLLALAIIPISAISFSAKAALSANSADLQSEQKGTSTGEAPSFGAGPNSKK